MLTITNSRPVGAGPQSIYIDQVKCISVEDLSRKELPFRRRAYDLAIKLTLDIGKSFYPEMLIVGNFKRDEKGDILEGNDGWGSAFKVRNFFSKFIPLGQVISLTPDNEIPPDVLALPRGKEFLRLSYVTGRKPSGRLRYSSWDEIATLEEGAESLKRRFLNSVTRGFPSNYHPEVLEPSDASMSFPSLDDESFAPSFAPKVV